MWHTALKSTLCWKLRGKGLWGKGLSDMCDELKLYLSQWSVEEIMQQDTLNASIDPLGLFPGAPNWEVADYVKTDPIHPTMAEALRRMGYDVAGVRRGDLAATRRSGCYLGTLLSSGMIKTDRPMDPAKDLLIVFWGSTRPGYGTSGSTAMWRCHSGGSRRAWGTQWCG